MYMHMSIGLSRVKWEYQKGALMGHHINGNGYAVHTTLANISCYPSQWHNHIS